MHFKLQDETELNNFLCKANPHRSWKKFGPFWLHWGRKKSSKDLWVKEWRVQAVTLINWRIRRKEKGESFPLKAQQSTQFQNYYCNSFWMFPEQESSSASPQFPEKESFPRLQHLISLQLSHCRIGAAESGQGTELPVPDLTRLFWSQNSLPHREYSTGEFPKVAVDTHGRAGGWCECK